MSNERWLAPVRLSGAHCALEPLAAEHHDGLVEASQDGELWQLWYTAVPSPQGMRAEIDRRLDLQARGSMLPFTTFDAAGRIVGMTTYMNVDAVHRRVEIGKMSSRHDLSFAIQSVEPGAVCQETGL